MKRLGFVLLFAVVLAAPLVASADFALLRPVHHRLDLFPIEKAEPAIPRAGDTTRSQPDPEPRSGDHGNKRALTGWFSRGVSVGLVGTAAIVFPGAGVGLEVTVPIQREISAIARAGIVGTIFFEGGYYDIGARGYFDTSEKFSLYTTAGLRMTYGRILDYAGGSLDHPIHRFAMGGFAEGGLEYGTRHVRFFAEISINGTRTFDTEFQVGFFCGVNFGVRFYFG